MARVLKGSQFIPAHPHHNQSAIRMSHTCLCLPAIAGTRLPTPEGWKAELAWVVDGYVVRQLTWFKFSCIHYDSHAAFCVISPTPVPRGIFLAHGSNLGRMLFVGVFSATFLSNNARCSEPSRRRPDNVQTTRRPDYTSKFWSRRPGNTPSDFVLWQSVRIHGEN